MRTVRSVLSAVITAALVACGGSNAEPSQRAACEKLYGGALQKMRSFMAEVDAGMTVGTFNQQYPKLAGPVQLAHDAAKKDTTCPSTYDLKVDDLYKSVKRDSGDPSSIRSWNEAYDAVQS